VRLSPDLEARKARALDVLRARNRVIVALSGGVDSAVLTTLAAEALGPDRVLAVTGVSDSLAEGETEDARSVCAILGVPHRTVQTREILRPEYVANAGDRCYHCRTELFEVLGAMARSLGYEAVAYGAIVEDGDDFRPGMAAAVEHGAIAPLLEAGLDKAGVRALAGEAGIPVRDKPASACLASRIPVGTAVTPERLRQVDRAESALRALGFGQLRVRHHGEVARLELDAEGVRRLADDGLRAEAAAAVRAAGFRFVAVDLEGYRTGSLNPDAAAVLYRIGPARESGQ
jgi:pyridinium-3,5-biscarboxylic acid mononucleotide sulfurtransferase